MKTYNKAADRLLNAAYKRGQFTGDAPVGKGSMNHRRYRRAYEDVLCARMYNTDVFTLHPNGLVLFDSNAWKGNRTTRDFIEEVMPRKFGFTMFAGRGVYSVRTTKGITPVYDGMKFMEDASGNLTLISPPKKFTRVVQDRQRTKELREKLRPICDMAELMVTCGDPGPHGYLDLRWFTKGDPTDMLARTEEFARGIVYLVMAQDKKEISWKDARKVFNQYTAICEVVDGPEFLDL